MLANLPSHAPTWHIHPLLPTRPSARRFQSTAGEELQTIVPSGQESASLFQIFSLPQMPGATIPRLGCRVRLKLKGTRA